MVAVFTTLLVFFKMREGGRRVIARGHDLDVVSRLGNFHLVNANISVLPRTTSRPPRSAACLHYVTCTTFFNAVRGRTKGHRVERTPHVRVSGVPACHKKQINLSPVCCVPQSLMTRQSPDSILFSRVADLGRRLAPQPDARRSPRFPRRSVAMDYAGKANELMAKARKKLAVRSRPAAPRPGPHPRGAARTSERIHAPPGRSLPAPAPRRRIRPVHPRSCTPRSRAPS